MTTDICRAVPVIWDYPTPPLWEWLESILASLAIVLLLVAGWVTFQVPGPPVPPPAPASIGQVCRGDTYLTYREETCWDGEVVVSPRVDR